MPKISIITANLNNAVGLRETIKSVESQTYVNYEYIIIDGGSIDGSVDVIKEYAEKITYWSSEPDLGVYDAMNKGTKKSNGEWVIYMNSGDTFYRNNVIQQIFSLEINPLIQILYGNAIIKENKKRIKPSAKINKSFFFYETICHQSIFFKRTIFEKIGYHNLNYKIIADREFLLRAAIRNLKFTYIDIDVCVWEAEGLSSKNANKLSDEFTTMKNIYFNNLEQSLLRSKERISSFKDKILFTLGNKTSVI